MRKERFLEQRNSKLQPRGDRSFQVLDRISDNAYKINLPGKYVVSTNLNAANLTPFDVGDDFKKKLCSMNRMIHRSYHV